MSSFVCRFLSALHRLSFVISYTSVASMRIILASSLIILNLSTARFFFVVTDVFGIPLGGGILDF